MKKSQEKRKSEKDSILSIRNRNLNGSPFVLRLRVQTATPMEAKRISQAIDRALGELVRQVREPRENRDGNL